MATRDCRSAGPRSESARRPPGGRSSGTHPNVYFTIQVLAVGADIRSTAGPQVRHGPAVWPPGGSAMMLFEGLAVLAAKITGASTVAQAAAGLGIAVAGVTGAGSAGVLPGPV